MAHRKSVYCETLDRLGFNPAHLSETSEQPIKHELAELHRGSKPYFQFSPHQATGDRFTIVFDELREVWVCKSEIDLSTIGFVFVHSNGTVDHKTRLN